MMTLQAGIEKVHDLNDPIVGCLYVHSKLAKGGREVDSDEIRRDFKD